MPESTHPTPGVGVVMPNGTPQHVMLHQDQCSAWLGISVEVAEPGHARISMTVRAEMTNGFGIIHGGMVFTLADTCFAMACNSPTGSADTITVASGADINFLRPARSGETLTATAREQASSGRSGIYDVTVTRGEDVIALFRGRSRTIPQPAG